MAYTEYEDVTPKQVNYRIIPRIRKYYRSDGTFDLFDISRNQVNCVKFLAGMSEAGFFIGRGRWQDQGGNATFGTYSIDKNYQGETDVGVFTTDNRSTLTQLNVYRSDGRHYAGVAGCQFLIKLNNSAGLYPYYISCTGAADHNGGEGCIRLYTTSGSFYYYAGTEGLRNKVQGDMSKFMSFNSPSSFWDYKDYNYVEVINFAVDTSKFTSTRVSLIVQFIHKFDVSHPFYRYFR